MFLANYIVCCSWIELKYFTDVQLFNSKYCSPFITHFVWVNLKPTTTNCEINFLSYIFYTCMFPVVVKNKKYFFFKLTFNINFLILYNLKIYLYCVQYLILSIPKIDFISIYNMLFIIIISIFMYIFRFKKLFWDLTKKFWI